jgi:hypothetical protein
MAAMGHGPIRLHGLHVRSYVNCGCAKTKGLLRANSGPDDNHRSPTALGAQSPIPDLPGRRAA